jgi:hypothetical protein
VEREKEAVGNNLSHNPENVRDLRPSSIRYWVRIADAFHDTETGKLYFWAEGKVFSSLGPLRREVDYLPIRKTDGSLYAHGQDPQRGVFKNFRKLHKEASVDEVDDQGRLIWIPVANFYNW